MSRRSSEACETLLDTVDDIDGGSRGRRRRSESHSNGRHGGLGHAGWLRFGLMRFSVAMSQMLCGEAGTRCDVNGER